MKWILPFSKGRDHAHEKAGDDYAKRNSGPDITWSYDIVSGSIKFSTCEQITKCLELMQKDPSIHIAKAKNRFAKPALTGYRDSNLCIQIDTHPGFKHICEIQIHHKIIKFLDTQQLKSHDYYMSTSVRISRELYTGMVSNDRLNDLKAIRQGGAVDASFSH